MKKQLLTLFALGMTFCAATDAAKNAGPEITPQEKTQMLTEADDLIDEIPEGSQDRQADAVLHALQGSTEELQQLRQSRDVAVETSDAVTVREICPLDGAARGINMRLYAPKSAEGKQIPLLVYFHGGGWTWGNLNSCGAFCNALAATGNIGVLAVDYSLAPENPFPRGLSDCISAVEYAFSNCADLFTSPELISVGGDGCGGNLALATALYFGENKTEGCHIRSLALFCPVVSVENDNSGSWKKYSRGYGLDRRLMEALIKAYDDGGKAPEMLGNISKEILKSPGKASGDMLGKFPPVLIISAERDILIDQGTDFAGRLKESAVKVERQVFPGAIHMFITSPGQPTAFQKAVTLTSDFLKK